MNSILEFQAMKSAGEKISVVTCYDYWSAKIIENSNVDAVLVGDSTAMVMHGYETTTNAEIEMMVTHVNAVRKGLKSKVIIGDMPFLAHRKGLKTTMDSVELLIKAGAQAVKIEGANGSIDYMKHIVDSGVPVMGHLGLTPQSIHQFGGFKVQGKNEETAAQLIENAQKLEDAGCFAMVLELVPADLAKTVTEQISIPTIGIGAGPFTSGQVLVLQDLLGMDQEFSPKFLKKYLNGFMLITDALNEYNREVKEKTFPSENESY